MHYNNLSTQPDLTTTVHEHYDIDQFVWQYRLKTLLGQ